MATRRPPGSSNDPVRGKPAVTRGLPATSGKPPPSDAAPAEGESPATSRRSARRRPAQAAAGGGGAASADPSPASDIMPAPTRATTDDGRSANVDPDVRRRMIAEAAYHRAASRGFEHGADVEDWLAAERDVDAFLAAGEGAPPF